MAKLKVSNPLTEGAPKAAAKVSEAAKVSGAKVSERAQNLGDFLRKHFRKVSARKTLRLRTTRRLL